MLKCREIANNASDYIDRDLHWSHHAAHAMHLLMCGRCRRFMRYFRLTVRGLRLRGGDTLDREEARRISRDVIAKAGAGDNGAS